MFGKKIKYNEVGQYKQTPPEFSFRNRTYKVEDGIAWMTAKEMSKPCDIKTFWFKVEALIGCYDCGKICFTYDEVNRHSTSCSQPCSYFCHYCCFNTNAQWALTRHMHKYHPDLPNRVDNIVCSVTSEQQVYKQQLQIQQELEIEKKYKACIISNKCAIQLQELLDKKIFDKDQFDRISKTWIPLIPIPHQR